MGYLSLLRVAWSIGSSQGKLRESVLGKNKGIARIVN